MNWPADASLALQRQLSFHNVWDWPLDFCGVEVLNRALVELPQPDEDVGTNESLQQPQNLSKEEMDFLCSCAECGYFGSSIRSLQMHVARCHSEKLGKSKGKGKQCTAVSSSTAATSDLQKDLGSGITPIQTAQDVSVERSTRHTEGIFSCNVAGCNFTGSNFCFTTDAQNTSSFG